MQTEATQTGEPNGDGAWPQASKATADAESSGIEREFRNLVADIEDLIQSNTSLSGEDWGRAKAKLHARVAAAKESVQKLGTPLIDRARNAVRGATSRVRKQPWQAMAIAAGASLLIGYFAGRMDLRRRA